MAKEQRGRKNAANDKRRVPKKKISILTAETITYVDYKDVNLLRRFMSERAKIRARRVTGNSTQQQREVAKAIRVAREMALLPYSVRQVTQRSKGGGRGGRGERGERELSSRDIDSTPSDLRPTPETTFEPDVELETTFVDAVVETDATVTEDAE
jgi:small subunit ribosomal protein S18